MSKPENTPGNRGVSSVWIELDDGIDRIIYDDEYSKPDEKKNLGKELKLKQRTIW